MPAIDLALVDGDSWTDDSIDALEAAIQAACPAGTVRWTVKTTADTGWLLLNGASITNADTLYPELWANSPAGWKSGSSLILPNMANRVFMGAGVTGAGSTGGANSRTLATANLPAHQHSAGSLSAISTGTHDHGVNDPTHAHIQTVVAAATGALSTRADYQSDTTSGGAFTQTGIVTASSGTGITIANNGLHSHSLTGATADTGSGTALDTTPAHLALTAQIKAH